MESRRHFLTGLTGAGLGAVAGVGIARTCAVGQEPRTDARPVPLAESDLAGDGSTDDFEALDRLLRVKADQAGGTVVLPPGEYRLGDALRIPSGVTLSFTPGARLSGEQQVTVEGGIEAGLHQVFDGVRVRFAPGRVQWVLPQWWGARGDGSHDDTAALQAAIQAHNVFLPAGKYRTTRELVVTNRTTLVGVGNSWSSTDTTDSWIQYDGPENPDAAVLRVAASPVGTEPRDAISSVHLERLVLDGGRKAGYGLYSVYCTNDSTFTDVTARFCTQHGFFIAQQWYSSYRNLVARNNSGCGITIGLVPRGWQDRGVNGVLFDNLRAAENGSDGRFSEADRVRWGYGVLFRPGAGATLRQLVSERNFGPGLIYDLGPRCSNRVESVYLEANGIAARRAGASTRAWGLVVIGHRNARANRVSSVYLGGEIDRPSAQSVWLTGEAPAGTVVLEDLSYGHHLHADWPRYRLDGYVYDGLRRFVVGQQPTG